MEKISSILDYSYPFLDPAVWDENRNLFAYQKDFILRLIDKMKETYGLKQTETWIEDIVILGSLTTSKWLFTSDMDVHIRVNLDAFIASNMPGSTKEQAFEKLDITRKEFDRAKILAPMTQHPIEFYFESVEFRPSNTALVGVYSLKQAAWLKEPVIFEADLDFEESKKDVIAQAEALAEELDGSLGKIQRDIQRVNELENVIKAWDKDKQQLFYAKVEAKLQAIEQEILKDLKIKQDLVDARHANQDAMSEIEVKFKWLARFGFFGILSNLKTLMEQTGGQITTQELPLIDKIISQGSLNKKAGYGHAYWIDPQGKIYTVRPNASPDFYSHGDWIAENEKLLQKQYGINSVESYDEAVDQMYNDGWARIGDSGHSDSGYGITVGDLGSIPSGVDAALAQFYTGGSLEIEDEFGHRMVSIDDPFPSVQQAVNKALQRKRMGSIKEAFLKEAFGDLKETDQDICVDFDKTIAKGAKHPAIGEPIEGAKESLEKLKDLGYNVIIYSCRGDTEEGLKAMTEWLDKHDMPYDSIFSGEKPFFKYVIDDKAIHFDSWDKVMEKVEKSDKTASLSVTARLADKYWIAPDGKEFVFSPSDGDIGGHLGWIPKNKDILKGYGIDLNIHGPYGHHEIADDMIRTGWTRITTESDYDFAMEVADINNLPSYLDNFVAHHYTGGGVEIDDLDGNYQDISDPFPTLRKAIYQAKRIRNAASLFSKKDIVAQTKKVKQGDYSCLMALVPHDLAQEIVEWGVRNVPDEDLYLDEDGKLGRELESHITIKYGLLTNDAKDVRRSFNDDKPFHAKLGKVRHFQPPELPFDVLTVEIVSDDLQNANKKICDNFECAKGLVSDEYKPHITIAYMKRDKAEEYVGFDGFEGKDVELDTVIFSPHKGNKTYFSMSQDKESSFVMEKLHKFADFLPSLFNAPDNDWQFAEGGPDKEIALQPDSVSDDTTEAEPCTTGKPRTKEVWRQFMAIFKKPISKKEDMTIDSAYDPELEEIEKNELGEDQTAHEYSKDFTDLNLKHMPHNTTWDSLTQDGEPSKPTSVTYSPQISNEDNLDQNSPGGYPRRFMGKPKGEWFSNEGEANNALINMLRNQTAAIDNMTIDIVAITRQYALYVGGRLAIRTLTRAKAIQTCKERFPAEFAAGNYEIKEEDFKVSKQADLSNAYWIAPDGKTFQVRGSDFGNTFDHKDTHGGWIDNNLEMLKNDYGLEPIQTAYGKQFGTQELIDNGWIRIGDSFRTDWGVSLKSLKNIPSSVDDLLAQFAPEGSTITVSEDSFNGGNVTFEWPVNSVQQAVNKASRQPVMAKQASIEEVNGIKVFVNPTPNEIQALFIRSKNEYLRGLIDPNTGDTYVWDGYQSEHNTMIRYFGLDIDWENDDGTYIRHIGGPNDMEQFFDLQAQVRAKLGRRKRKASIEKVNDIPVFVNPTEQELVNYSQKLRGGRMFRGLFDPHTGDLFVWDGYLAVHQEMIPALGLDIKYSEDSPYCLYFPPSSVSYIIQDQKELCPKKRTDKQAGDQSASVPDYLINEWKTDQLHDDISEEPYVNHDQRDYPYGMHDSPENTGTGIGWPKDNSRAVVRLDTLENPAYRLDPFGIGEYNITYYTAMPASDGIEQMNDE